MPDTTGPRSNRNPILRDFRGHIVNYKSPVVRPEWASFWADKLTGPFSPASAWLGGATVSEQVFAARVLYRYAAVFGGAS